MLAAKPKIPRPFIDEDGEVGSTSEAGDMDSVDPDKEGPVDFDDRSMAAGERLECQHGPTSCVTQWKRSPLPLAFGDVCLCVCASLDVCVCVDNICGAGEHMTMMEAMNEVRGKIGMRPDYDSDEDEAHPRKEHYLIVVL